MATDTPSPELKRYNGNCHCGAFKFHIEIPELTSITECNCSMCFKRGYKWVFPGTSFVIDKGEGTLKEYEFGNKTMSHCFCPKCGTGVLGSRHEAPKEMKIGINVSTLMDVDVLDLKVNKYDGAALEPAYKPHEFTGKLPAPTLNAPNPKLYTGSCHCGAITLAFLAKGPLSDKPCPEDLQVCDCSICTRNGTILIYPSPSQVSISVTNPDDVSSYSFGREFNGHEFCSTCGIAVQIKSLEIGEARWKEFYTKSPYERHFENAMVNLRVLEGVEWENFEVPKGNWSKQPPKYVCPK